MEKNEAGSNPEQMERDNLAHLREVCERVFPEIGLGEEDIRKIFYDAQGSFSDAVGAVYGHLLEAGEDPDELFEGAGILLEPEE